jgi:hypothetical protein
MSGFGGGDRPAGALEELDAKGILELADGLRQRRLSHVQARGGAPEMQLLVHGEEVPEVPQLDGRLLVRASHRDQR